MIPHASFPLYHEYSCPTQGPTPSPLFRVKRSRPLFLVAKKQRRGRPRVGRPISHMPSLVLLPLLKDFVRLLQLVLRHQKKALLLVLQQKIGERFFPTREKEERRKIFFFVRSLGEGVLLLDFFFIFF